MTVRTYNQLREQYNSAVTVDMLNAFGMDALESMQMWMDYASDMEVRVASLERTQMIDDECIALLDARCEELQEELQKMKAKKAWEEMAGWDY